MGGNKEDLDIVWFSLFGVRRALKICLKFHMNTFFIFLTYETMFLSSSISIAAGNHFAL